MTYYLCVFCSIIASGQRFLAPLSPPHVPFTSFSDTTAFFGFFPDSPGPEPPSVEDRLDFPILSLSRSFHAPSECFSFCTRVNFFG